MKAIMCTDAEIQTEKDALLQEYMRRDFDDPKLSLGAKQNTIKDAEWFFGDCDFVKELKQDLV